jgi:hypothetical protein
MGKMHGKGEFTHVEGRVLQPYFCNNLYNKEGFQYVNPFLTQEELKQYD